MFVLSVFVKHSLRVV